MFQVGGRAKAKGRANTLAQFLYAHWVSAPTSEPASYTWQFNSASDGAGGIAAYRGTNPFGPMDDLATKDNSVSAVLTTPSVMRGRCIPATTLMTLFAIANNAAISKPSTMLSRWSFAAAGGGISVAMANKRSALDGPTGAVSATASAAASVNALYPFVVWRPLRFRPYFLRRQNGESLASDSNQHE
jgi:hypothetical protein